MYWTHILLFLSVAVFGAGESKSLPVSGPFSSLRPCVRKTEAGYIEPATLRKLTDCQYNLRLQWVHDYNEANGGPPPNSSLDILDDLQRKEVRDYLARHPDRANLDDDTAGPPNKSDQPVQKVSGQSPRCRAILRSAQSKQTASKDPNFQKQQARTEQAMQANLEGQNADLGQDLMRLNDILVQTSDNGQKGITQEGAFKIMEFLECQQGTVSNDMMDLLDHAARDGSNLHDDTMLRLKQAVRSAKSNGLQLGVEPSLEKWLLDPSTDPTDDNGTPAPGGGSNLN